MTTRFITIAALLLLGAAAALPGERPEATLSARQMKRLAPGLYEVPESHGLLLTLIEPGVFTMGSPTNEVGRGEDETKRRVAITKPFYMGIVEVTQAQYLNAMHPDHMEYCQNKGPWGHTLPSFFAGGPWGVDRGAGIHAGLESDHPMDMLSWEEAAAYAAWLNRREAAAGRLPKGYVYRLPTEAEWEYACRAGSEGPFGIEGELEAFFGFSPSDFDGNVLCPFGRRKPNPWGLYDMHGSLYEWVHDWYGPYEPKAGFARNRTSNIERRTSNIEVQRLRSKLDVECSMFDVHANASHLMTEQPDPRKDPKGPSEGDEKVMRGGSYMSYREKDGQWETTAAEKMRNIRSASRNHLPPDYQLPITGMRLVLGPALEGGE